MYFNLNDTRKHLNPGDIVEIPGRTEYVIDRYVGCGGFSLMYIAHARDSFRHVALKELFPRHVENNMVERRDDGTIVIYNPITQTSADNTPEAWENLVSILDREAELTRKAAAVWSSGSGTREAQNSADVLQVSGPFTDVHGNRYLAVDTAQGEPFTAFIERGFVRDSSDSVVANGNLEEILAILEDATILLSRLHGDSHLLHLDISPDNLYLTLELGGTRLCPRIIDYGSAYDLENPEEAADHRYTCNPWSAPEVLALAELNSPGSGYHVDASSDTYAIVSILFYAVTGTIFKPEMRFSSRWKSRIRDEYLSGGTPEDKDSFAERLISMLEKGLASRQSLRYTTARELADDFAALRKACRATGRILPLMDPVELQSYALLERYPLYAYPGDSGDLDVLCIGSSAFTVRMILSMLSVGQMTTRHLNLHVVTPEPAEQLRSVLLSRAPSLPVFSNLEGPRGEDEYVTFSFETCPDLLKPEGCARIAETWGGCHYMVISLGRNGDNISLARLLARALPAPADPKTKTVIHYSLQDDAALNVRADVSEEGVPAFVELAPFGGSQGTYASTLHALNRRTLRVNYLYEKLANPRISFREAAVKFSRDAYGQASSCAAAVSLRYKLSSLGLNPSPKTNHKSIVSGFTKAMQGSGQNEQMYLEHRRWIMYMVSAGYRLPTEAELRGYAFHGTQDGFIAAFRNSAQKLHHCMVPCSDRGICLPSAHDQWDLYQTVEEIDATDYDPLDRVSLKLHLYARHRLEDPQTAQQLLGDFDNHIGHRIRSFRESLNPEEATPEQRVRADLLLNLSERTRQVLQHLSKTLAWNREDALLRRLDRLSEEAGLDLSAGVKTVLQDLELYREFGRYRDYKAPDADIVNNMLWILYAPEDLYLVKLPGRTLLDSITAPLLLEPKTVHFVGMEKDPELEAFLRRHGNEGAIRFEPRTAGDTKGLLEDLRRVCGRASGTCVIDLTGCDVHATVAALQVAEEMSSVAIVSCDTGNQKVENISGFHRAPIYHLRTGISAEEVYRLYGSQPQENEEQYMFRLQDRTDALWAFYQEYQDQWTALCAFFATLGRSTSDLFLSFQKDRQFQWRKWQHLVHPTDWENQELRSCFRQMESAGVIRNLKEVSRGNRIQISLQYPGNRPQPDEDFFPQRVGGFMDSLNTCYYPEPFRCTIGQNSYGNTTVSISSGVRVSIDGRAEPELLNPNGVFTAGTQKLPVRTIVRALRSMEKAGLVYDLTTYTGPNNGLIRYAYENAAVRTCLQKAGNILELYAWRSAQKTGYFDDCRPNFSFQWREGVQNELDLVLTRGLNTLVVSCKIGNVMKEHLYEIRYLTERFSLNSQPVLLCARIPDTPNGNAVLERAKAMGVHILDLSRLSPDQLGQALVDIAEGTYTG